ncbi:MAG: prepilin-type N-terminal cleavage/methylation domain-containing protein [Synergistales bacterium]|nr:prepilin-type N-terminal cleavage/methylation domain-containing protein [Synergistales bacterium]
MKQWLKKRKGRGFTLVELLIVIVIIGILAGSLLLVMGSGTDKANATKIVSDMRTLKAAALMYYADEGEWPPAKKIESADDIVDYLDRIPSSQLGEYSIVSADGVFVQFKANKANDGYVDQLEKMKDEVGLTVSSDTYRMRITK